MDCQPKIVRLRRKHRSLRGGCQALKIADTSRLHELEHLGRNKAGCCAAGSMRLIRKGKAIRIGVEKHQAVPLAHKDVARIPVAHGNTDVVEPRGELAQIVKTRPKADAPAGAAWRIGSAARSILARFV